MLTRHLLLSICGVVICLLYFVNCFNLESRLPIVKYGEDDSYFGYSVATHVEVDTNGPDERTRWWVLLQFSYLISFLNYTMNLVFTTMFKETTSEGNNQLFTKEIFNNSIPRISIFSFFVIIQSLAAVFATRNRCIVHFIPFLFSFSSSIWNNSKTWCWVLRKNNFTAACTQYIQSSMKYLWYTYIKNTFYDV